MADALDLRHRMPQTWASVLELACEPWVACKVARMSRRLERDQAGLVDQAALDRLSAPVDLQRREPA